MFTICSHIVRLTFWLPCLIIGVYPERKELIRMLTPIADLIPLEVFDDLMILAETLEFEAEYTPEFLATLLHLPYASTR
jgi:hypothetical protein